MQNRHTLALAIAANELIAGAGGGEVSAVLAQSNGDMLAPTKKDVWVFNKVPLQPLSFDVLRHGQNLGYPDRVSFRLYPRFRSATPTEVVYHFPKGGK